MQRQSMGSALVRQAPPVLSRRLGEVTRHIRRGRPCRRAGWKEGGAALAVVLFVVLVLLLMGASAARMALQGEKAARGGRDWHTAFHAAEEALMDAENDIEGSAAVPGRSALFRQESALGFESGCGQGASNATLGLCLPASGSAPPVWQSVDLAEENGEATRSVPFGAFTGASMQTGTGLQPFKRPRYIIELLPYAEQGHDAGTGPRHFYRVTAIGFGAGHGSQVILQSYYRKQTPGGTVP
jgi:type IV pilus assembly protein PilX